MAALNEITPAQLLRLIGTPDCPAIIDVTLDQDFDDDPYLIPGAIRHPHTDPDGLFRLLDNRPSIIVCQKGRKLSQGMAALLRSHGHRSEHLAGGNLGWRDTPGAPRVPANALPAGLVKTLWVTRHRPKIDRIACPWLIRRFVDADARFLFVSPSEVADVADRYGAVPFDIPDVPFGHHDDGCTFDSMVKAFGLATPALTRLAQVVRAADLGRLDDAPQAAGLLALSVGLSRLHRDDAAQLDAALPLYDALYRWARDAHQETHGAPGGPV